MSGQSQLLLGFYGDDFTGSADTMEALSLNGARTALFLEPPAPEQLTGRFAGLRAVGVAGISRSLAPAQMGEVLPPVFARMKQLGPAICQYKVCSTFDSSPEVGSIGRAIEIGQEVFGARWVPLLVGAPPLERYCLFGNLFAGVGGEAYRLDRHPTMSRHPVTPMRESDLRLHLARQTDRRVALMDILSLTGDPGKVDQRLDGLLRARPDVVLFDVLDEARLEEAGRLIWSRRGAGTNFAVGSSGLDYALAAHWRAAGVVAGPSRFAPAGPAERLIVVSGSCSPVTKVQIEWALARGFTGLRADVLRLADPGLAEAERARIVYQALDALGGGPGVVIYTALGPEDPHIATGARDRLGAEMGRILRALLEHTRLRRAVLAGGDTSGHAARELELTALELLTPMAPGSPLCRAASAEPWLDGLELALKGGQGGKEDYFGCVLRGGA